MDFPHMLIVRNTPSGCIWQAYVARNEHEFSLLSKSAIANGFCISRQPVGYAEETTPGWRDTQEWKDYSSGKESERARGQRLCRELLKPIARDGPYWLGGYNDWLVACFSLRGLGDMHGFTPVACWSECDSRECKQWLVCQKDGQFFVDALFGSDSGRGYGLKPAPVEEQTYPPHIFDWIFKKIIPSVQPFQVVNMEWADAVSIAARWTD